MSCAKLGGLKSLVWGVALAGLFPGAAPVLASTAGSPPEAAAPVRQDSPGEAERDARLSDLESKVRELEAMLESLRGGEADAARMREIERRLDVLSRELEKLRIGEAATIEADESVHGLGPAASKVYRSERGVTIGGYGEMLFQGFDSELDSGARSSKADEIDFLRAIVYFGYKFDDRILFNSEIEFEHASTGKQGEASVEFASLDFLLRPQVNVRTGLLLVPMGFVNELHEPPIFLGARRPDVENALIPTTWREAGAGIFGDLGPVSYRAYVVNGLDGAGVNSNSGFSAGGIRGGRQKGSKARAENFAFVGRADWQIIPSVSVGGSYYFGDSGQGAVAPSTMQEVGARTRIHELHGELRIRGLEVRALHVAVEIDDVALLNDALGLAGTASVGEEMEGHYVQLGYDVLTEAETDQSLIPYLRYEGFDTQVRVPAGFMRDPARDVDLMTYGLAYKPIEKVVFKVDYQDYDNGAGTGRDQWNVAVGWLF